MYEQGQLTLLGVLVSRQATHVLGTAEKAVVPALAGRVLLHTRVLQCLQLRAVVTGDVLHLAGVAGACFPVLSRLNAC